MLIPALVLPHRLLVIELLLIASPLGFLDFCGTESDNSIARP